MIIWLQFSIPTTVATSISSSHLLSFSLTFLCDPSLFIFTSSYSALLYYRQLYKLACCPISLLHKPQSASESNSNLWLHLLLHQIQKEWHSVGLISQETTFGGPGVARLLCHGICLIDHALPRIEVSSIHPYAMEIRQDLTSLGVLGRLVRSWDGSVTDQNSCAFLKKPKNDIWHVHWFKLSAIGYTQSHFLWDGQPYTFDRLIN